jgi:two-component system phosphate regulon sensor histidine kinase PhoR
MAGETALVIDDNAASRRAVVESVLRPGGYTPMEAESLEAAAQMMTERIPDLILLSALAPGLSGPEALDRLSHNQSLPIILMSARLAGSVAAELPTHGVRDILYKPFEPKMALRAIERVLSEANLRRERDELAEKLAQTRRQMEWQLQELNAFYTVGKTVTAMLDLEQVLSQVVEAATYMTRAEEGSLLLLDETSGDLYLRAAKNLDQRAARGLRVHAQDSLMGRVLKSGRPVRMAGPDLVKIKTAYRVKALLYVPLKVPPERIIGVLGVANRVSGQVFGERDMFLLSALGDFAAVAIENARLFNQVEMERSKLEAVLRGTEDAVIVLNQDKSVLLCNPAARRAFNIELPSITGRPLSEAVHSQALLDLFARSPAVGRPTRAEVQLADGRTLQAQVSAIEGIGYAAVMQDITHLKELDRIRSEFVSVVSHDLRSPLTTIRGYVELLPRVGPLTPQQTEFVNRVGQSMKTITDLVGDLLDVGRIEAGLDQEFEACHVKAIVQRALEALRMSADEKRHKVRLEAPPDLPPLMGNPRRLEQVVTNLLTNAIKYTPPGGQIQVILKLQGTYLMLRVEDNGIGIPLEDQPHVFDKFYRVQSKDTAEIMGTGLGLSIVKSVVEKHGGRVWVESQPGQGSAFTVLLPTQQ